MAATKHGRAPFGTSLVAMTVGPRILKNFAIAVFVGAPVAVVLKDLTPEPYRTRILEANMRDYDDPLGPTVEWLRKNGCGGSGCSWSQIIEKASRPGDLKRVFP